MTGGSSLIDLTRNSPPVPSGLAEDLGSALVRAQSRLDVRSLMNDHRYGGTDADREAGAAWLAQRFGQADLAGRIILTNGTMNAVLLALSTLVGAGGLVLAEQPGALHAWPMAQMIGARVEGIPIDDQGVIPEAFEAACGRDRPAALFCVPTLQNPTTAIMPEERRRTIIDIAARHGVAIIEDDICGLLPPDAPSPIAALAPEITWYATGLNKSVSPGLRVGYLVAPSAAEATRVVARFKSTSTWFAAPLSAELAISWINDGTALRILRFIRSENAARQAIAADMLGDAAVMSKPQALQIWLQLPDRHPGERFAEGERFTEDARRQGVAVGRSAGFMPAGAAAPHAVRVCLGAAASREQLRHALSVLAALYPPSAAGSPRTIPA